MIPPHALQTPVNDLVEFIQLTLGVGPTNWVFRGQTKASWILRPKAGRPEFYRNLPRKQDPQNSLFDDDIRWFLEWRAQAVAYADALPTGDMECLAYAQHYGLATRLLDWTSNPLVALFFAVERDHDEEGVVYCHHPTTFELEPNRKLDEAVFQMAVFRPRPFDRRILAQHGVFTYHYQPEADFPASPEAMPVEIPGGVTPVVILSGPFRGLLALTIPGHRKRRIMQELNRIGTTRKALFPDPEGLSSFINWRAREAVFDVKLLREQMRRGL